MIPILETKDVPLPSTTHDQLIHLLTSVMDTEKSKRLRL